MPSIRRAKGLPASRTMAMSLEPGGPDSEQLKIYHDEDDDDAQQPAGHGEGCFGNRMNARKFTCAMNSYLIGQT